VGSAKRTGDNIPGAAEIGGPAIGALSTLAACDGADDQERFLTRGDSFG
jgi:hypothetical protein